MSAPAVLLVDEVSVRNAFVVEVALATPRDERTTIEGSAIKGRATELTSP